MLLLVFLPTASSFLLEHRRHHPPHPVPRSTFQSPHPNRVPLRRRHRDGLVAVFFGNGNANTHTDGEEPDLHRLPNVRRVLVLSDLHTDHVDNMKWLRNRTTTSRGDLSTNDLLVVAGDISHDLGKLKESLRLLTETGASVLFVPGNHEAWLSAAELKAKEHSTHIGRTRDDDSGDTVVSTSAANSLHKLDQVYETCRQLGVLTGCTLVGRDNYNDGDNDAHHANNPIWILPLESWYDATLRIPECDDLIQDFGKWPWVDFIRCRWPEFSPSSGILRKIPLGLTELLLERNRRTVLRPFYKHFAKQQRKWQQLHTTTSKTKATVGVMTVSHFLPNQQCLPDWKDVKSETFDRDTWLNHGGGGVSAKFALVAGTDLLDQQIRNQVVQVDNDTSSPSVRQIHVFGHSHRPKDFEKDGIRYIHNPLGKPREREIYMVNPKGDFQLVWDTSPDGRGEVPGETIVRYWEEQGGGVNMLRQRIKRSRRKSRYVFSQKQQQQQQQELREQQKSIKRPKANVKESHLDEHATLHSSSNNSTRR